MGQFQDLFINPKPDINERTQGGTWTGGSVDDADEIQLYTNEYDWETHRIDDMKTQKRKENQNDQIIKALKKLGVTEIKVGKNSRKI